MSEKLNYNQERFCQLYASDEEFFWNWVQAYIEVYKPDQSKKNRYKTACASVSRMLSNVKLCNRINELLEEKGLNDEFVDKQLLFLITQHDEKSVKLWAIKEYNTLKARIEKGRQKALNEWAITTDAIQNVQVTIKTLNSSWTIIE